jgi:hypothetical protein
MSASLPRAHGRHTLPKTYVILVRKNASSGGQTYIGNGYIVCDSCGGGSISKGDLEDTIGVPKGSITKFLNRAVLRVDVAERIRNSVKRVEE